MIQTLDAFADELRASLAESESMGDESLARVVELRQLCIDLVVALDETADDAPTRAHLLDVARDLHAQTDRLLVLAAARRDELTSELRGAATSRRAAAGYHSGNGERGERGSHVL